MDLYVLRSRKNEASARTIYHRNKSLRERLHRWHFCSFTRSPAAIAVALTFVVAYVVSSSVILFIITQPPAVVAIVAPAAKTIEMNNNI